MAKKADKGIDVSTDDTSIPSLPPKPRKKQVDTAIPADNMDESNAPSAGTQEHTMSEQITIQGLTFNVPVPYSEGHPLTAGEASALNQVFHENLRNNFAARIKKLKEAAAPIDADELQKALDEYAGSYAFGVRTSGGPRAVADPVKREAINLAKAAIKAALAAKGKSVKDAGGNEWLAEKAAELVETRPQFTEQAKARLAEQQALASDILGS